MNIIVTGVAGFIGAALADRLLNRADVVTGVDNLNDYYDVGLKLARLDRLKGRRGFTFLKSDIADRYAVASLFQHSCPEAVVHLAAQPGVRYSIQNPHAYGDSNLTGFLNILEGCRQYKIKHLVFASSSAVYGANTTLPFSERHNVDHPISLYGATKKANEVMAHSYAHLYAIPCTGLRFFTVYGPWCRPDMALFKFTKSILEGKPIQVFNNGDMERDFTYIDDIVEGILRVVDRPALPDRAWNSSRPDPSSSSAPYRLYNIGNNRAVSLMRYIELLEKALRRKAVMELLPIQDGDLQSTFADVSELEATVGYRPSTPIDVGIPRFVDWYQAYHSMGSA